MSVDPSVPRLSKQGFLEVVLFKLVYRVVVSVTSMDLVKPENIGKSFDDNMQIGFGLPPDEYASIVPLRYLFLDATGISIRGSVRRSVGPCHVCQNRKLGYF